MDKNSGDTNHSHEQQFNVAREEEPENYSENGSGKIKQEQQTPLLTVIQEPTRIFKTIESESLMDRYDTEKLFLGVQRHLLTILCCIVLFGVLGALGTYKFLTTYKAESVVLYQVEEAKSVSVSQNGGVYQFPNFTLPTVLDLIQLPANFSAVKSMLGLDLSTKEIEGMVEVPVPRNDSNLVKIIVKGDNKNLVVDIANALAKISVKASQEFYQKQLQATLESFENELTNTRQKLATQLNEIEAFKKQYHYFGMGNDREQPIILTLLENARSKYQDANLRYNALLVEYENLKRQVAVLPDQVPINVNGLNNPLQDQLVVLEGALAQALTIYTASNPKVIQLQEQIKELKSQLTGKAAKGSNEEILGNNTTKAALNIDLMRMEGQVRAAQKVKQDIAVVLDKLEKEAQGFPAQQVTFSKLMQDRMITEAQIQFLNNGVESSRLLMNIPRGSLDLYQLADTAKQLNSSWYVDVLPIIGLFFGLCAGLLLAMFFEMTDNKLRTAKQINMAYNIPCIEVIPEISFLTKKNAEEKTLFYVRELAEKLELIRKEIKSHAVSDIDHSFSIALTSSLDHEGKSLLSYYLTKYYGRLGKKAVLLQFDWRTNPYIEDAPQNTHPIESYLRGISSFNDILIRGKPDRIKVAGADPGMKELVKSSYMQELWETLKAEYDVIIIDCPNLIKDDYGLNLATLADTTLVVVDSGKVDKPTLDHSLQDLYMYGAHLGGIILNRVMPIYINDERIKLENKRSNIRFLQKLIFWR